MSDHLAPSTTVLCKLASIVVHADEYLSPGMHTSDELALRGLLVDTDVAEWIAAMSEDGLAPVKRS